MFCEMQLGKVCLFLRLNCASNATAQLEGEKIAVSEAFLFSVGMCVSHVKTLYSLYQTTKPRHGKNPEGRICLYGLINIGIPFGVGLK